MYYRIPFFIISICLLAACSTKAKEDESNDIDRLFPILHDTASISNIKYQTTWLNTANYKIYYIGKPKDSIEINYDMSWYIKPAMQPGIRLNDTTYMGSYIIEARKPFKKYFVGWMQEDRPEYLHGENCNLEITVDTNQRLLNKRYEAYPVMIKNLDTVNAGIAYGDFVGLLMEANYDGEWKLIEEPWIYMCGNGIGNIILPPGEIIITSAYVYTGPQKTLLRWR
ncbi:MAG: hypothetical protein MK078_15410 [Crocinitomicaceae bacterium]|nr:hypothetical protein [Crocinitomicaceae bacterium]